MTLTGKGFFIWKIKDCESGSASAIAAAAKSAGLSHVLIKIADGVNSYNVDSSTGVDYVPSVVSALHSVGIQAWGWHYIYGENPGKEAWCGGQRTKQLGLDGYVIDAESEYKASGMAAKASRYMTDLRSYLGNTPVALSSFRFPAYHMQFPWNNFLTKSDFNLPQVYWEQAHNPGAQLQRSFREFNALTPYRPFMATGAAYGNQGWVPLVTEITEFMTIAVSLNIPAVNFYSWDYCRKHLPALWNTIAAFPYPTEKPVGIVQQFINALNTHNAEAVAALYTENAVHITALQTIQGRDAIQSLYSDLFLKKQPGIKIALISTSGIEPTQNFGWTTTVSSTIRRGTDTLGLTDGLISYHYSSIC